QAALDELRVRDRRYGDVNSQVVVPLRLQEFRGRLVEGVLGVVGVGQTLGLRTAGIGRLQELLGLGRVELGQWVLVGSHVADQCRRDQPAGRGRADDVQ